MILAAIVTWSVLAHGLPELRHDWRFPLDARAMPAVAAGYAQGWTADGLGAPQPYPTFFPLATVLWPLALLGFSPLAIVALIVAGTTLLATTAAMRIARNAGASTPATVALALVAVLNPWVFTEEVAGHPYMILAYAVVLALIAEIGRAVPREWALGTLAALSIIQIEFFLILAFPFAAWCVTRRRWGPLFVMIAFAAPLILGIFTEYQAIRETPYTLAWQERSSIALDQGALLTGYGPDYARSFVRVWIASSVLALLALLGALLALRTPIERIVVLVGVSAWLFASGTRGPIAPLYRALVLHVTESGVYRELYDLIAFVAIATVVALARSCVRRDVAFIALTAAAVLAVPWITSPVADAFVSASDLRHAAIPERPNERIALLPAFQPLSFEGRGSGTDPDAYARDGAATPLNEWFPSFPVDVALAYAERDGDDRELAALGVTQRIERPYLRSEISIPHSHRVDGGSHALPPRASMPLLSFRPERAPFVALGDHPDENAVFFGDVDPRSIHAIAPSHATIDPMRAWVDARLAVPRHPEDGSAFGGVLTTSALPLSLPPANAVLARTDGELDDDRGRRIATPSASVRWWSLPHDARALRCHRTCVVVLTGDPPPGFPAHHRDDPRQRVALPPRQLTPWLSVATLPAGGGTLRYNVRYDAHWAAWTAGGWLPHTRIATAVNGWFVAPSSSTRQVIIVEVVAAAQAALEVLACAVWSIVVIRAIRSRGGRAPHAATDPSSKNRWDMKNPMGHEKPRRAGNFGVLKLSKPRQTATHIQLPS